MCATVRLNNFACRFQWFYYCKSRPHLCWIKWFHYYMNSICGLTRTSFVCTTSNQLEEYTISIVWTIQKNYFDRNNTQTFDSLWILRIFRGIVEIRFPKFADFHFHKLKGKLKLNIYATIDCMLFDDSIRLRGYVHWRWLSHFCIVPIKQDANNKA